MRKTTSAERREHTAAILAALSRPRVNESLKVTGIDGSKPVVVAFADESIGDVFERVSWSAGFANLFVVMEDGNIALASVVPPASSLRERDAEPLELLSPDSPIGMLVEASRKEGVSGFNLRIASATAKIDAVEDARELVEAQ